MSCRVGPRWGSDLAWLWLGCRLAAAALIRPPAWELPYATGTALKRKNIPPGGEYIIKRRLGSEAGPLEAWSAAGYLWDILAL